MEMVFDLYLDHYYQFATNYLNRQGDGSIQYTYRQLQWMSDFCVCFFYIFFLLLLFQMIHASISSACNYYPQIYLKTQDPKNHEYRFNPNIIWTWTWRYLEHQSCDTDSPFRLKTNQHDLKSFEFGYKICDRTSGVWWHYSISAVGAIVFKENNWNWEF